MTPKHNTVDQYDVVRMGMASSATAAIPPSTYLPMFQSARRIDRAPLRSSERRMRSSAFSPVPVLANETPESSSIRMPLKMNFGRHMSTPTTTSSRMKASDPLAANRLDRMPLGQWMPRSRSTDAPSNKPPITVPVSEVKPPSRE